MVNATHCPACGHVNAIAAEACASCGEPLPAADIAVHPGETFRDPDDLSDADELRLPAQPAPTRAAIASAERSATRDAVSTPTAAPRGADTAAPPARARVVSRTDREEDEAAALRTVAERMARRRALAEEPMVSAATRPAHYAGFVIRLVAFAIDVVVLGVFTIPVAAAGIYGVHAGLVASGTSVTFGETEEALGRLVGLASLAMATIYFTVLHGETGQTIGKAVVGIAVRRARDLARIGVFRSFVRVLGYLLSAAAFLLGFLTIMVSPRKRGWHDYLAGTCVVHLAPEEV